MFHHSVVRIAIVLLLAPLVPLAASVEPPPLPPTPFDAVPAGAALAFSLDACPAGWAEFAPAAGRVLVGAGEGDGLTPRVPGDVGGAETHRLTVDEMPRHQHGVYHHAGYHGGPDTGAHGGDTSTRVHGGVTSPEGGDGAHDIMPPFLALRFCERLAFDPLAGEDVGALLAAMPAGAVAAFDLDACPAGWTDRADAAGRVLVGAGAGDGLTPRAPGEAGGAERRALTLDEMPRHQHGVYHHAGYHGGSDTGAHGGDTGATVHGGVTSPAGGGAAHEHLPPFLALRVCEKLAFEPLEDVALAGLPAGGVAAFAASECPPGWAPHAASAGRALLGAGEGDGLTPRALGESGGKEAHALTLDELPRHQHGVYHHAGYHGGPVSGAHGGDTGTRVHGGVTSPVGGGAPHNHMPPFLALPFCTPT